MNGSGCTLSWLARTMMERPVDGEGGRTTRLVAYLSDIVRRADEGDLNCRMFLVREVGRGDRRKETAQRNAKRAKSEDLRKFEEEKAAEISSPVEPLPPEVEDDQAVTVSPTAAAPHAKPDPRARVHAADAKKAPTGDSSMYRRDPATGRLITPEGRELTREEEEKLLYPNWPHVSPHLKKAPSAGDPAGPANPARDSQETDSKQNSSESKFSRECPAEAARKQMIH